MLGYSPPVNRMTDRCKKITFPQLLLRAVITKIWQNFYIVKGIPFRIVSAKGEDVWRQSTSVLREVIPTVIRHDAWVLWRWWTLLNRIWVLEVNIIKWSIGLFGLGDFYWYPAPDLKKVFLPSELSSNRILSENAFKIPQFHNELVLLRLITGLMTTINM